MVPDAVTGKEDDKDRQGSGEEEEFTFKGVPKPDAVPAAALAGVESGTAKQQQD